MFGPHIILKSEKLHIYYTCGLPPESSDITSRVVLPGRAAPRLLRWTEWDGVTHGPHPPPKSHLALPTHCHYLSAVQSCTPGTHGTNVAMQMSI